MDPSPAERQLAMAHRHWASATRSFVEFPRAALERSIPERFEQVAGLYADRVAVATGSHTLTYAALNRLANRLAQNLITRLGPSNEPVAFLLEPDASPIVAILGIMKAGKIYVALDPAHPPARLGNVLRDSQARLIVTDRRHLARAEELRDGRAETRSPVHIVLLDELEDSIPGDHPGLTIPPDALAAIFYTSGSTGQSKGVILDHRYLLHRSMAHTNACRFCCDDREPQFFSYSVAQSLGALDMLLNGGLVLPYDLKGNSPTHLAEWLAASGITVLQLTSGMLRQLAEALPRPEERRLPRIRLVSIGGDPITRQDILLWRQHFSDDSILGYWLASTETSRIANIFLDLTSPIPEGTVPVGFLGEDKELLLLGEDGSLVETGKVGEIVVRSRYLSPGYWRRQALTDSVFRPDPEGGDKRLYFTGDLGRLREDGALEFMGRKDFQVKIRGHTINLNEVEAALLDTTLVKQAAVTTQPRRDGHQRLVAYLVSESSPAPTVRDLRGALQQVLPDHMIPSAFVFLDELPRTHSGKVDRNALPAPERRRLETGTPYVAPRTELEAKLADLWAQVLDLDRVGIHDNFFELGGDSLSAMLMILETERLASRSVPPECVRDATIATLAQFCETGSLATATPHETAVAQTGPPREPLDRTRRLLAGQVTGQQALRWAISSILLHLDYEQGIRWLHWIGQPAIANRLYRQERELLRCVAESLQNPSAAGADALRISVLGNIIWNCQQQLRVEAPGTPGGLVEAMHASRHLFWRSLAGRIDGASDRDRTRVLQFTGLEYLYYAHRLKHGTILVTYHSPAAPFANAILSRYTNLGTIPTLSLESAVQLANRESLDSYDSMEQSTSAWSAVFALHGQRILTQGGVVQVANDVSYDDSNSIRKSIGGRLYDLKPGLAELALTTGATILPVYSTFDLAGTLHMNVLPALAPLRETTDRETRIHDLLDQYVAFLQEAWRNKPESIGWGSMRRFCTRPLYAAHSERRQER